MDINNIMQNACKGSKEHEFIIDCLCAALDYCSCQFENSDIDWMPPVSKIDPHATERDKYILCKQWLYNQYAK